MRRSSSVKTEDDTSNLHKTQNEKRPVTLRQKKWMRAPSKNANQENFLIITIAIVTVILIGGIHMYMFYHLHDFSYKDELFGPNLVFTKKVKKMTLREARERGEIIYKLNSSPTINTKSAPTKEKSPILSPLSAYDREYFTIRINTYRRNEQLLISLNHHAKCAGVAQIQVVWCDEENEPPPEIVNHSSGKVYIEYHSINSLNERFHVLENPTTLGILSIDDDVLRPCLALDAGFFKWTMYPHRMIAFDGRMHLENQKNNLELLKDDAHIVQNNEDESRWKYGYLSDTQKSNRYSIGLTRFAFIHVDYLHLYYENKNNAENTGIIPNRILDMVNEYKNCEDIAMSFMISSLTCGNPPLMPQRWAVETMLKLYTKSGAISSGKNHKIHRDECVDKFADLLNLKESPKPNSGLLRGKENEVLNPCLDTPRLHLAPLSYSGNVFKYGAQPEDWEKEIANEKKEELKTTRKQILLDTIKKWDDTSYGTAMMRMKAETQHEALEKGLIAHTKQWRERWNIDEDKH